MEFGSTRGVGLPALRRGLNVRGIHCCRRGQILIALALFFCLTCGLLVGVDAQVGGISLGNAVFVPIATPTATPVTPTSSIFVTNPTANSLSIFPLNSNGNVASLFSQTLLANPKGIAYLNAQLYVVNQATDTITLYSASANGSPNPLFTISGSNTQLHDPVAVVFDSNNLMYVANRGSLNGNADAITVYPAGSSGNVAPKATIVGANTGLLLPSALTLDSHGNVYVTNEGSATGAQDSITVYAAGANGNATPASTISGSRTGLASPMGIAVDSDWQHLCIECLRD